ncbi:putative ribonuclease H-like domain-containing protein [Tanacetum coccineum]|uniref:Ribonuclease H-like domain-containing protein n=1 Tax=Tanacetum coccineum TaxID=301880 RepID=A0ABQ5ADZ1_9ASTR
MLVAQGHMQEEGIDYDEVFAPVARIEAIRIFLAFASYMGFIVYQMDVKSAFLYGKIDEEVYVSQPIGFIDPKYPKNVYKVVKALYGLHQAPKTWYATLSTFLLKNGYRRGTIDKTFFIKKDKHDIILVQVYVDDIIFGSTKNYATSASFTTMAHALLDPLLTKLEFPQELSKVHNTFHVSNLKKCYANEPLAVPLDRLHFDDKLHFVEEPIEIIDREVKRLKRSRIPLVKVRWNSKRGPEFTWEREDQFKEKYPHLFTKTTPSSSAAS